jgi:hypothetical protein
MIPPGPSTSWPTSTERPASPRAGTGERAGRIPVSRCCSSPSTAHTTVATTRIGGEMVCWGTLGARLLLIGCESHGELGFQRRSMQPWLVGALIGAVDKFGER